MLSKRLAACGPSSTRETKLARFNLFRRSSPASAGPATPEGRIVYAVGDVHGRADLLGVLIGKIRDDASTLPADPRPVLVFLGDYVDRGAQSREVIDQVIAQRDEGGFEVRTLKGNHEDALATFLGDPPFGQTWADYGGMETLRSYGVAPPQLRSRPEEWEQARDAFGAALPPSHIDFLNRLELMAVYGDYAFVHAGVRPGAPLEAQTEHDLLTIRDAFLRSSARFEKVIVHGHTPEAEPFVGERRIGVDTGAYATGVLTAVRLMDADRTIIQAT